MHMTVSAHIYNLKAVTKEVGLSPATLRAWERRYGVLKPQRSAGGHRLYSRQDIDMLKWLVEKQKTGLSISSAVEMWKRQQQPYTDITPQTYVPAPVTYTGEAMIDELRVQWIEACLVFDDAAASRALDQAFATTSPETICIEVLQKGMAQIGEGWYNGSISVQQEHFACEIAMRRIDALMAASAPPRRAESILVTSPPGEEHGFILLMLAYLLRRHGWEVIYLGSNVPLEDLGATIQSISPKLIVSAAQTLISAASLRGMAESIVSQGIPLAYGGGIFKDIPAATRCIPGYYLGTDLGAVPQIIDLLVTTSPTLAQIQPISPAYTQTLALFEASESKILGEVRAVMQTGPYNPTQMEFISEYFTQSIASALALGEIDFLDPSIDWLNGLLNNRGVEVSQTRQYYAIYREAVDHYLGQDGVIIHNWLTKYILPV
jgi:DNA-binding transcriptional MerR regulator